MGLFCVHIAYHLGEGRVLKTYMRSYLWRTEAYHLGEGRVLKTEKVFNARVSESVSPWGRARTQDIDVIDLVCHVSVSPWGRARAQD